MKSVRVPLRLWLDTWGGLEARGAGRREAACVWAGPTESAGRVNEVVFLDDLGEVCSGALHHRTPTATTRALFELLRSRGLEILADVHTHPSDWVELSQVDQEHPIEYRVGLLALVIPGFAVGEPSLDACGLHEYLGDLRWRQLKQAEYATAIKIEAGAS